MYFTPSCCCLVSAGKKTSKSQSSNLSRSLESLGKESDDSRVSKCSKGHLRSACLDRHITGSRCDMIHVMSGQDTRALTWPGALAVRAIWLWIVGYFPVANKTSLFRISSIYPNFRKSVAENFCSVDFPPSGNFRLNGSHFGINSFRIFWKPFKKVSVSFAPVSEFLSYRKHPKRHWKLQKCWVEWKAPPPPPLPSKTPG